MSIRILNKESRWIAFFALYISLLFAYHYIINIMMAHGQSPDPNRMMKLQAVATLILSASIIDLWISCYLITVWSTLNALIKNIALSITAAMSFFLIAECFFLHYEKSDGIGSRWSYRLWDKKFLNHRFAFDYIDSKGEFQQASFREPVFAQQAKRNAVWFIGDSFTFGFGVEQTDQTFPALVEKELSGRIRSVNLGDGGADTYEERSILLAFDSIAKEQPGAVVWQYFGNDIDSADRQPEIYEKNMFNSPWKHLVQGALKSRSFFLDYLYWQIFFGNNQADKYNSYVNFLGGLYLADSVVMDKKALRDSMGEYVTPYHQHLKPLKDAATYYKSRGTKFLVIIFPYLWRDGTEQAEKLYARRLSAELSADSIDVIDLAPLLKDIEVDKRVVNLNDPHPSVMVHQIVADTIARYFVDRYNI